MSSPSHEYGSQTLGAYLLCLREGAPCPCCGVGMRKQPAVRSGTPAVRQREAREELICVECGCELTEVQLPFENTTPQSLSPAA